MDLTQISFKASPNINKGRGGKKIQYICLHSMAGTFVGSSSWFSQSRSKVSAHYLIGQAGELLQMVADTDTAFAVFGLNQVSISIEMEDKGKSAQGPAWVTPKLYETVVNLTVALCKKHGLTEKSIIRHCDPFVQETARRLGKPVFVHSDPGIYFPIDQFKADVKAKLNV